MIAGKSNHTFQCLAKTAQQIAETRSSDKKSEIFSDYLRKIESDTDLDLAVRFLGEGAFSSISGKRVSVGSRTYSACAADFCEIDYEKVFQPCRVALGSPTETIEKLMSNIDIARTKRTPALLTLSAINGIFNELCNASSIAEKRNLLNGSWTKMSSREIKYFLRILGRESLGIGMNIEMITEGIARAFGRNSDEVRAALIMTGSIGRTAVLCRNDTLEEAEFRLFHPIPFMRATRAGGRAAETPESYMVEEKLDGVRCQVHLTEKKVALYSYDLNEITSFFPEVVLSFLSSSLPDMVLDGVLCLYRNKTILPSQFFQKRMKKKPDAKILSRYPVLFIAFDILCHKRDPVFKHPFRERRKLLERLSTSYNLPITNLLKVQNPRHLDELLDQAIARGNDGVMLKKKTGAYRSDKQSAWLKLVRPDGLLKAVILYVHTTGETGDSDSPGITCGISVADDRRYEEEFLPIGTITGGYAGNEKNKLNRYIRELKVERFGPTLRLKPEIMVELEYDHIRVNRRTKANYVLHHPRLKRFRWDLTRLDTTTLREIERMYQDKIDRHRLKQEHGPSFYTRYPNHEGTG